MTKALETKAAGTKAADKKSPWQQKSQTTKALDEKSPNHSFIHSEYGYKFRFARDAILTSSAMVLLSYLLVGIYKSG